MMKRSWPALAALALAATPVGASTYSFNLQVALVTDVATAATIPDPAGTFAGVGTASITLGDVAPSGFKDYDETDLTAFSLTLYGQSFTLAELSVITDSTVPPPLDGPGVAFDAETVDGALTSFVFGYSEVTRVASPTGGAFEFAPGSLIAIDEPDVLALTGVFSPLFSGGPVAPDGTGFVPVAVATSLAPIPLPGGLALALAGLGALTVLARRRRG